MLIARSPFGRRQSKLLMNTKWPSDQLWRIWKIEVLWLNTVDSTVWSSETFTVDHFTGLFYSRLRSFENQSRSSQVASHRRQRKSVLSIGWQISDNARKTNFNAHFGDQRSMNGLHLWPLVSTLPLPDEAKHSGNLKEPILASSYFLSGHQARKFWWNFNCFGAPGLGSL